jgi:hypothetical protein
MGCCLSSANISSMYGYRFTYKTKDIKMYRYIVYEGVKFYNSVFYEDGRLISKEFLYPFVVNDMYNGKFMFTDEYSIPLMSTSSITGPNNKHKINTDISSIVETFNEYFVIRQIPNIICSKFSYEDHLHTSSYKIEEKLLYR